MGDEESRRTRARERVAIDLAGPGALPARRDAGPGSGLTAGSWQDAPEGGPAGLGTAPPGRLLDPAEAAALLRGATLPPDAAARFGERLAQIAAAGLVPETSDAQARAHLARRRAAGVGGVPPRAIAGPAPARLQGPARARLAGPGAGVEPEAANAAPARPAANLPMALGRRGLAPHDPAWTPEPREVEPRWWSVYDVPAYLAPMIRALGEQTFRSFPCFAAHREAALGAGEDPLGSIRLLACLDGSTPNGGGEIDHVARWIQANGVVVSAHQLAFPTMAGYEPRVILAAHGGVSYLFVEELRERGAPLDARYVYAWKGGMDFYLGNREALAGMRALAAPEAGRPAAGQRGRRLPAAEPAAPPAPARIVAVDMAEERRRRARHVAALPQAGAVAVTSGLLQGLRALGFRTMGTPQGPVLRKETEEGSVLLSPPPGSDLPGATYLLGRRLDASGAVLEEAEVADPADAERLLEPASTPSP